MNSAVFALAASGSSLFAGGLFTTVGAEPIPFVAQAVLLGPQILVTDGNFGFTSGRSRFGFDISGGAIQTLVVQGSTDLLNWVPLETNLLSGPTWYFSDPSAGSFPQRFYRVVRVP